MLDDALTAVFTDLGFDALDDAVFRELLIARIVESTSILDNARVLTDLGTRLASEKTMRRPLTRAAAGAGLGTYRDQIAELCFTHAATSGDVSLCLYGVTTLSFEAEKEYDLRKVGFSKERRVDPQIVVGQLVARHGFLLEIGCYEGNQPRRPRSSRSLSSSGTGTTSRTWSSSPTQACSPRTTRQCWRKPTCASSSVRG